jgi:hypothetical protein
MNNKSGDEECMDWEEPRVSSNLTYVVVFKSGGIVEIPDQDETNWSNVQNTFKSNYKSDRIIAQNFGGKYKFLVNWSDVSAIFTKPVQ